MSSSAATTSTPPLPVVVCGAYESTGKAVIEGLKPEYEVILFCKGADALATELPQLLTSPATFSPQSSTLGSGNFTSSSSSSTSHPPGPRAVVFGGFWGPEDISKVQDAILDIPIEEGTKAGGGEGEGLVFLRNDKALQPSPESGIKPGSPEYSDQIIRRVRGELAKLVPEGPGVGALRGVEEDGSEGVYWY